MKPIDSLIQAARNAHRSETPSPESPPLGFSTRVAARWAAQRRGGGWLDLFERAGWYGAGVSAAICLGALVYRANLPEPNPFDALLGATELIGA